MGREPEPETYDDFLRRLSLEDKKEGLADCGLDEGLELKQLSAEMVGEADLTVPDILVAWLDEGELELDAETKAAFRSAVAALKSTSKANEPEPEPLSESATGNAVWRELCGQLDVTDEAILDAGRTEVSLEKQLAEKDTEIAQLKAQLEKMQAPEGVPPKSAE